MSDGTLKDDSAIATAEPWLTKEEVHSIHHKAFSQGQNPQHPPMIQAAYKLLSLAAENLWERLPDRVAQESPSEIDVPV